MNSLIISPPKIVQNIFPNFIWKSKSNKILLTFDDGPNPNSTEIILKKLADYHAEALFFCVGNNISKYPSLAKEILSAGQQIGNHSLNHESLTFFSPSKLRQNLVGFNKLEKNIGSEVKYFRPPRGRISPFLSRITKELNLQVVMWSLLTLDYLGDLKTTKNAIQSNLTRNSIVVFHDSNKSKNIIIDSIDIIFETSNKFDFQIGKINECLS